MQNVSLRSLLLLAIAFQCIPIAHAQSYTLQDLGTLRHGSARVHDINSLGDVVGGSGYPHGGDTHAFFWSKKGGLRDLGVLPGGDTSAAFAINDSGQVVGTSNAQDSMHAFVWTSQAGMTQLPSLQGTNSSSAYSINRAGEVAGVSGGHAAVWNGGTVLDLGTLGGTLSEAHSINNVGQVVGFSQTSEGPHAFLWSNGTSMQDLGTLPGDNSSRANKINDQGAVVGASEGTNGVRAFYWSSKQGMQAIDSLQGGSYCEAFALNNAGQVVGQSGSVLGTRAFIWTAGGATADLNLLVTNLPPGTILTAAFSINDNGQIVAFGVMNPNLNIHHQARMDDHLHSGPTHVFLLTPVAGGL